MLPLFDFTIELESDSNSISTIRHRAQSRIKPEPQIRVELNLIEFEQFGPGTQNIKKIHVFYSETIKNMPFSMMERT